MRLTGHNVKVTNFDAGEQFTVESWSVGIGELMPPPDLNLRVKIADDPGPRYPKRLPEPDCMGSYYLGKETERLTAGTIFPSRHPSRKGKYHASDWRGEPLTEDDHLRWFDSAAEALRFLRAQVGEV